MASGTGIILVRGIGCTTRTRLATSFGFLQCLIQASFTIAGPDYVVRMTLLDKPLCVKLS